MKAIVIATLALGSWPRQKPSRVWAKRSVRECEDEDSHCRNPTLKECEDEIHTAKIGIWESSRTPKILEFDYRDQNISHWNVLYIIGKSIEV
jgi:hypothetical protein